jgi:hypothetical protein
MQVTKVGNVYKVARITGPQHNFLGLAFSEDAGPSLTVERLQVGEEVEPSCALDEPQLLAAVQRGIAAANAQFGTHFCAATVQYVVTDTPDMAVYTLLAHTIVEAAWRETTQVVSAVRP